MYKLFNNFNGGEWSPLLWSRSDLEKFDSACRCLENFVPLAYGGVRFRPGFESLSHLGSDACRLLPFYRSDSVRFLLVFSEKKLRVFGEDIDKGKWECVSTLETPYTEAMLPRLQTRQLNDVLYLVHPAVRVYRLEFDDEFHLVPVVFDYPPTLDENVTDVKLTLDNPSLHSLSEGVPNEYSLCASESLFDAKHLGSQWVIRAIRPSSSIVLPMNLPKDSDTETTYREYKYTVREKQSYTKLEQNEFGVYEPVVSGEYYLDYPKTGWIKIDAKDLIKDKLANPGATYVKKKGGVSLPAGHEVISPEIMVEGSWQLITSNTWRGTLHLERKDDMGVWEPIRSWHSSSDRNVSDTSKQEKPAYFRMRFVSDGDIWAADIYAGDKPDTWLMANATFDISESFSDTVVTVTGVKSDTECAVSIDKHGHASTVGISTKWWMEGAFSDMRGYPSVVAFHEQRLILGGTKEAPNTFWGSVIDDFHNFRTGVNADDSITYRIAAAEQNEFTWLVSGVKLIAGTSGKEFSISSGRFDDPIEPSNISIRCDSSVGSAPIPPCVFDRTAMFVGRLGTQLFEFAYNYQTELYTGTEVSLLARHITQHGIHQIARANLPDSILLSVLGNGELGVMTYDGQQNVAAWSRWTTSGEFASVATLRGKGVDDVFAVVKRACIPPVIPPSPPPSVEDTVVRALSPVGATEPGFYMHYTCRVRFRTFAENTLVRASAGCYFIIPKEIQKKLTSSSGVVAPDQSDTDIIFCQAFAWEMKATNYCPNYTEGEGVVVGKGEHFIDLYFSDCDNPNNYTNGAQTQADCSLTFVGGVEILGFDYSHGSSNNEAGCIALGAAPLATAWETTVTGSMSAAPVAGGSSGSEGGIGKDFYYSLEKLSLQSDDRVAGNWLDSAAIWENGGTDLSGVISLPEEFALFADASRGKDVTLVADGRVYRAKIDLAGNVVLPRKIPQAKRCVIGFPYIGKLQTMRTDFLLQTGSTQGRVRRIDKIVPSFFKTNSGKYGPNFGNLYEIQFRATNDNMDATAPEKTADFSLLWNGGTERTGSVCIVQDEPAPMTLLGVSVRVEPSA